MLNWIVRNWTVQSFNYQQNVFTNYIFNIYVKTGFSMKKPTRVDMLKNQPHSSAHTNKRKWGHCELNGNHYDMRTIGWK